MKLKFSDVPITLRLAPSHNDLDPEGNEYWLGLDEFHESIRELEGELAVLLYKEQEGRVELKGEGLFGGTVAGLEPQLLVDLVMWLGGPSVFYSVHKFLSLWVNKVKGRRIVVRTSDLQIEATQLSAEEFAKLWETIACIRIRHAGSKQDPYKNIRQELLRDLRNYGIRDIFPDDQNSELKEYYNQVSP